MSEQNNGEPGVEDIEPESKVNEDHKENDIKLPKEGELLDIVTEENEEKDEITSQDLKEFQDTEGQGKEDDVGEEGEDKIDDKGEGEMGDEEESLEHLELTSLSSTGEEEEPKEPENVSIDREACIARYKELMEEKTLLSLRNMAYNKKCVEYFRRKKIAITPREDIEDVDEVEKKYTKLLFSFDECNKRLKNEQCMVEEQTARNQSIYDEKDKMFFNQFQEFQDLERQTGKGLLYCANGKRMKNETIELNLSKQIAKLKELNGMRLKYIIARNTLNEIEKKLRDVDQLDEGFLIKDFEKLQETNISYMKKLEEKDATLLKEKAVCATYVEMLAHMKEQMHFEVKKCEDAKNNLGQMEDAYTQVRIDQNNCKHYVRRLQKTLKQQQDKMGIAVYPKLYADFKQTRKNISKLQTDLEVLNEELERAKLEKTLKNESSIFKKHCVPSTRTCPKLHKSVFLLP